MTRGKRVGLAALAVVVVTAGAGYGYTAMKRHRMRTLTDELPVFTEVGPGPRAPTTDLFGLQIGRSALDPTLRAAEQWGFTCGDTSMRALMHQAREAKRQEIADAKARGLSLDAITGASTVDYISPKERNPQVRLSCERASAEKLHDRQRPPVVGRLLLVFDSPKHPLRHASFDRSYADPAQTSAIEDYFETCAALQKRYGTPTKVLEKGTPVAPLAIYDRYETTWSFADLTVGVALMNYGKAGTFVSEHAEVPWPVRADAPSRPSSLLTAR